MNKMDILNIVRKIRKTAFEGYVSPQTTPITENKLRNIPIGETQFFISPYLKGTETYDCWLAEGFENCPLAGITRIAKRLEKVENMRFGISPISDEVSLGKDKRGRNIHLIGKMVKRIK